MNTTTQATAPKANDTAVAGDHTVPPQDPRVRTAYLIVEAVAGGEHDHRYRAAGPTQLPDHGAHGWGPVAGDRDPGWTLRWTLGCAPAPQTWSGHCPPATTAPLRMTPSPK